MNDFSELENQLRKLRPPQPSADLTSRIERALAEVGQERSSELRSETARLAVTAGVLPQERRFHFNWLSLGLGLAAAAALVLFTRIQLERPEKKIPTLASITPAPQFSSPISTAQFVPAGLTQVVYHTRETLRWRNPTTGASLRISYPSEEVSLVPVTGQ